MITVGDLKGEQRVRDAVGREPSDSSFCEILDAGVRRLMQMAEWDDAIQDYCFNVCGRCIYVPPEIKHILGVQIDHVPGQVFNRVFSYIPNGPGGWMPAARGLIDRGNQQVFITQTACPSGLVIVADECEDVGAHLRVQALDAYNRPIIGSTGHPFLEFNLGESQGHIHETRNVARIVQVTKTQTRGNVYVYLLDAVAEQPADLVASIQPWQTSAEYRMYELAGPLDPGAGAQVRLHARRRHTKLYHDDQAVLVDSVDAIVAVVRLQKAIDGRDTEGANLYRSEVLLNLRELSQQANYRQERRMSFAPGPRLGNFRKMGR